MGEYPFRCMPQLREFMSRISYASSGSKERKSGGNSFLIFSNIPGSICLFETRIIPSTNVSGPPWIES